MDLITPTAESLKRLRKQCNWTETETAEKIHITEKEWMSYEKGSEKIPLSTFHLFLILAVNEINREKKPSCDEIKNLRAGLGITQDQLAVMTMTSARHVFRWENDDSNMRHSTWLSLQLKIAIENPSFFLT